MGEITAVRYKIVPKYEPTGYYLGQNIGGGQINGYSVETLNLETHKWITKFQGELCECESWIRLDQHPNVVIVYGNINK